MMNSLFARIDAADTLLLLLLLLFCNVGAGVGALLCPLRIIDMGPFSRVADDEKRLVTQEK